MTMATMVAMMAIVGGGNEPPDDFDFSADNSRFKQLQSEVIEMGKEDLKEAQEIASMTTITKQHLKQVQKAYNKFDDTIYEIEDIFDRVEENAERGSRTEKLNIERKKSIAERVTKYRNRMDELSAVIEGAINIPQDQAQAQAQNQAQAQAQAQIQKKGWRIGDPSLKPRQLESSASLLEFNKYAREFECWTIVDIHHHPPPHNLLYGLFLSTIESTFKENLERSGEINSSFGMETNMENLRRVISSMDTVDMRQQNFLLAEYNDSSPEN